MGKIILVTQKSSITDIFSVAATYAPILIAFTSGIIFVYRNDKNRSFKHSRATNQSCDNCQNSMGQHNVYNNMTIPNFFEFLYILIGAALDPESIDDKLKWDDCLKWDIQHYVAAGLYIVYQITIVIILINLLIAVMNASVSSYGFLPL